ncbi:enoyl-CoA hydratase-related protein [Methylobacterium platani]|uniref:Enoyl-CoA hydratase n=2 Tax=Methylobacterium platani TaxID=427683 RepID=A0A179SG58_9HYPH|nr:enoyl-CoA hydratase-related protein [Methylobacterium platani]KMO12970.1 enoyl-CoA hydratase [Methylobacterium platani JCM 14648]OAS25865.1 enoyl-CoA hydratase [Methylobacterium platani]
MADPVLTRRIGDHVALVTLNRPRARNAVDPDLARALAAAVAATEADDAVRAVVLAGEGPVFCAGADLKVVADGGADGLWIGEGGFAGFVHARRAKPWIAAIEGPALAGGCEIALACELIVAGEGASFGLPEVTRGLVAAAGGLYRLPRALPRAVALELILTGARLEAARAHALGLVNRLAAIGAARDEAVALATAIAANAPLAVRESLAVARLAPDADEAGLREASAAARARVQASEDYREGPRAFVEKRPPRWTGR